MRGAAYLVLPSLRYDALPRALIEAFANGAAGHRQPRRRAAELIEPGRNGLLFEPGSARDLARRLAWAEAFPENMRQMGECARGGLSGTLRRRLELSELFGERRRSARLSSSSRKGQHR